MGDHDLHCLEDTGVGEMSRLMGVHNLSGHKKASGKAHCSLTAEENH